MKQQNKDHLQTKAHPHVLKQVEVTACVDH